eukprot:g10929.t2
MTPRPALTSRRTLVAKRSRQINEIGRESLSLIGERDEMNRSSQTAVTSCRRDRPHETDQPGDESASARHGQGTRRSGQVAAGGEKRASPAMLRPPVEGFEPPFAKIERDLLDASASGGTGGSAGASSAASAARVISRANTVHPVAASSRGSPPGGGGGRRSREHDTSSCGEGLIATSGVSGDSGSGGGSRGAGARPPPAVALAEKPQWTQRAAPPATCQWRSGVQWRVVWPLEPPCVGSLRNGMEKLPLAATPGQPAAIRVLVERWEGLEAKLTTLTRRATPRSTGQL